MNILWYEMCNNVNLLEKNAEVLNNLIFNKKCAFAMHHFILIKFATFIR